MATTDREEVFTIKDAEFDIGVSVAIYNEDTFVNIINRQQIEVITLTLADFRRVAAAVEKKLV